MTTIVRYYVIILYFLLLHISQCHSFTYHRNKMSKCASSLHRNTLIFIMKFVQVYFPQQKPDVNISYAV